MKKEFRLHQSEVFNALIRFVNVNLYKPNIRGYVVMPPRSGKTLVFSELVRRLNLRAIVVSPTILIADQNMQKMKDQDPDLNIAKYYDGEQNLSGDIIYTTYQSLVFLLKQNKISPDLVKIIIFDEAHRSLSVKRSKIPDQVSAICLAFTATDKFSEEKNVKKIFHNEIYRMHLQEAVELGICLPLRGYIVETHVDLRQANLFTREFLNKTIAEKALNIQARNKAAVDFYLKNFSDMPAVAFCVSVNHTKDLAKMFRDMGIEARAINRYTSKEERRKIINDFDQGKIKVLCSVNILIEGWDSDKVLLALNLRITRSWVLAEQRACRVAGKTDENKKWGIVAEFQDIYSRNNQPIFVHHLFQQRTYRDGGYVLAPRKVKEKEEKIIETKPVYIAKDLQVSCVVKKVISLNYVGDKVDFTDQDMLGKILLSQGHDYEKLVYRKFADLTIYHSKFKGTGQTFMRKFFKAFWYPENESGSGKYKFMINHILDDHFFWTRHEPMRTEFEPKIYPKFFEGERNFGQTLNQVLSTLASREESVLRKRFFDNKTLGEVGVDLNVTRERIRQIEAKALRKLRHPSRNNCLKPFIELRKGNTGKKR